MKKRIGFNLTKTTYHGCDNRRKHIMKRLILILFCAMLLCGGILFSYGTSLAEQTPRAIESLADLQGSGIVIGVKTGTVNDQIAQTRFPDAEIKYLENFSDLVQMLASGQIDVFIDDEPILRAMEREMPRITHLPEFLQNDAYALAFPKTDAGFALSEEVSAFIVECRGNGVLDELDSIWYGEDENRKTADTAKLSGVNGTLRIGISSDNVPFCYIKDNEPAGLIVDLLIRFCEKNGYLIEWNTMSFPALIPALASGKCDLAAETFSITEERKEQVYFSEPFYNGGVAVAVLKSRMGNPQPEEKTGFWQSVGESFEKTFIREQRWKLIVQGVGTTVIITLFAAIFGTIFGFGICMLNRMANPVCSRFAKIYIRLLQGTPIVVLLMILFYLVFAKTGLTGEIVAIIGFSMNFAAYVAEIIRTGIEAVDIGQTEAALAIGYTKSQAFFSIVMPQAARHFLPVYKGEFVSLVKSTSIVGYIAVQDLTKMSDIIRSRTYEAFFPLIATAAIYFLISGVLAALLRRIELRIEPDRKHRCVKGVKMQ